MNKTNKHKVTILPSEISFNAGSNQSILDSALSNSIILEHSCKTGECGVCEVELMSDVNSLSNKKILICQVKPSSDIVMRAEYYPDLSEINCVTTPAKVNEIIVLTEDIIVLELRLPPHQKFDYLPGQYIDLKYQGVTRSYSLASPRNEKNTIELHLKKVQGGEMSEKIFLPISTNQLLQIEGPKGTFFLRNRKSGPIIFVATGTGFAPVKAIVNSIIESGKRGRNIYIYWGNRSPELFYDNCHEEWVANVEGLNVELCLSKSNAEWSGRQGYVQDCIVQDLINLTDAEVYACGSYDMIQSARKVLVSAGLSENCFYSDAFVAS